MSDYYYRPRPVWEDPSFQRFEAPPMTDEQRQVFLDLAQWITDDIAQKRREAEEKASAAPPPAQVPARNLLRRTWQWARNLVHPR